MSLECDNYFFKINSSRSWNCSVIEVIVSNYLEIDLSNFETNLGSTTFSPKFFISTIVLDSFLITCYLNMNLLDY